MSAKDMPLGEFSKLWDEAGECLFNIWLHDS